MQRRTFATLSLLSLAVPLLPSPARGQQARKGPASPPPIAPALIVNQIVTNVDNVYNQMKTFKASFKQRYIVAAYNKTMNEAGSVIFQKPGKMSWRYTSNGNRVVSDGQIVRIYDQGNQQMYMQPFHGSQYPALSFLTGQGSLKQSFTFTLQSSANYPSGYVLLGLPLQATASLSKVYFYVDAKTFQVRRVIIEDAQLNRNRFDFQNPVANSKPPPNTFVFTPPPGTRIIQGNAPPAASSPSPPSGSPPTPP